eukprot:5985426-Prymnesium_polylepis.1
MLEVSDPVGSIKLLYKWSANCRFAGSPEQGGDLQSNGVAHNSRCASLAYKKSRVAGPDSLTSAMYALYLVAPSNLLSSGRKRDFAFLSAISTRWQLASSRNFCRAKGEEGKRSSHPSAPNDAQTRPASRITRAIR